MNCPCENKLNEVKWWKCKNIMTWAWRSVNYPSALSFSLTLIPVHYSTLLFPLPLHSFIHSLIILLERYHALLSALLLSGLPSPVAGIILGWQEAQWGVGGFRLRVQLGMRKRRRGGGHEGGRGWGGGDGLDNEIDAMWRGCSWPNGMISDLKEKEYELMMRNGVNIIWMEGEETKKPSVVSLWCFLSLSGLSQWHQISKCYSVIFCFNMFV